MLVPRVLCFLALQTHSLTNGHLGWTLATTLIEKCSMSKTVSTKMDKAEEVNSAVKMDGAKEVKFADEVNCAEEVIKVQEEEIKLDEEQTDSDSDDVVGYITSVSDEHVSTNNNSYFDVNFKSSPVSGQKIRVMSDMNYDSQYFQNFLNQKSPIKFHALSPSRTGKLFFNPKTGSSASQTRRTLPFTYDDQQDLKISAIKATPSPKGTFSLTGRVEWLEAERRVSVGTYMKSVRDAQIFDDTDSIGLAVWEPLIGEVEQNKTYRFKNVTTNSWNGVLKVTTTMATSVELVGDMERSVNIDTDNQNKVMCCPEIIAVKVEEYFSCRNISCRKKILVQQKQRFITCRVCNRKMATEKLNHTFTCDVTLEKANQQVTMTMFPNVINTLNFDLTILDEEILNMEDFDFHYTKKRVVTKVVKHEDIA